jgi:hypothetical protein
MSATNQGGLNWTEILRRAGIPEPPGREETIAAIKAQQAQRKGAGQ